MRVKDRLNKLELELTNQEIVIADFIINEIEKEELKIIESKQESIKKKSIIKINKAVTNV